jgi:hypothetical protein
VPGCRTRKKGFQCKVWNDSRWTANMHRIENEMLQWYVDKRECKNMAKTVTSVAVWKCELETQEHNRNLWSSEWKEMKREN